MSPTTACRPRPVILAWVLFPLVAALLPGLAGAQVVSSHPRMILDNTTLATLRQRAQANTPEWKKLKAYCDAVLPGAIKPPVPDTWADVPNIGSQYQGMGYTEATFNLGLCYQVMKGINATAANAYGDKLARVLDAISRPRGDTAWVNPCTDSGYGIRNFGVALGIGYDWAYDRLNAALKNQIIASANAWISTFETNDCTYYQRGMPNNYYAGYFHAKAAIALGTFGDNAAAPAQWSDWLDNRLRAKVLPYFNANLAGGGWPEGFGNYGPSAILHMSLPAREVKTATGIDLVNPADGSAGYAYPIDSAIYPMHFSWPSRAYFDDRDTNRSSGDPDIPPGTNVTGMYVHLLGALSYYGSPLAPVMRQYLDEVRTATNNYSPASAWQNFLFLDPSQPRAPLSSLPRSYLANGMGAVAARADWSKDASWMSLRAGPYVEDPNHGEQYFDQGSLALVRGGTPLLINASGWVVHENGGTADENRVYDDNYSSFRGTQYDGNRQLYNVFYVRRLQGSAPAEAFGQTDVTPKDDPRTRIAAFQDADSWVYVKAAHVEDMYRRFAAGPAVASWSREVLYLRPNRFVVYDRTRKGAAGYDQYLAFHFPAAPANVAMNDGTRRVTVNFRNRFAGAATFVYPAGAEVKTVPMYPDSNPVKAWQLQVRPGDQAQDQRWLSVFDLSADTGLASASRLDVGAGPILGTVLSAPEGTSVVVAGTGDQDSVLATSFAYSFPAAFARHVVLGVAPGSAWSVNASCNGNRIDVSATPGGNLLASSAGVLEYVIDGSGEVRSGETLFFAGFDP